MSPGASLWGRLGSSLADNSSLLMALGGGLAGARTWGEGIGKALSQGSQVSAAQQKASDMQRAQTQTYEALLARGVPRQLAVAAAQNPTLLKYVLNRFASGGQQNARSPGLARDRGFDVYGRSLHVGRFVADLHAAQLVALRGRELALGHVAAGRVVEEVVAIGAGRGNRRDVTGRIGDDDRSLGVHAADHRIAAAAVVVVMPAP